MDRLVKCAACGRRFVALRRDATTCSARCRKQQSRAKAAKVRTVPSATPKAAVTGAVTLTPPPPGGWLPVVAAVPPPAESEPEPAPVFVVPTRVDEYGRVDETVRCEDETAAAMWDARQWRND